MQTVLDCGFWNLPHCSKLDELTERRHAGVIVSALRDADTKVERDPMMRGAYTLYGPREALLLRPESPALSMAMTLYSSVQDFLGALQFA